MESLQKICLVFSIIGAIVWGIIGFFNFNVVSWIFGDSILSNIIYIIVGICGLINIGLLFNYDNKLMKYWNDPMKYIPLIQTLGGYMYTGFQCIQFNG